MDEINLGFLILTNPLFVIPKDYFIQLILTELTVVILTGLLLLTHILLTSSPAVHKHRLAPIHLMLLLRNTTLTAARRSCFPSRAS